MKRLLFFLLYSSFFLCCATAQQVLMREVFASMPDSVLPLVTKNNRLDCIDFIENNMDARVRNKVDEYVVLEALTEDYARFRTSASAVMELKLLPFSDSTSVLCVVTTAEAGVKESPSCVEDSNIRFLSSSWAPLPAGTPSLVKTVKRARDSEAFFVDEVPDSLQEAYSQAHASLCSFHPVRMALSPDDYMLTLTIQPGYLASEEKKAVQGRLRTIRMAWTTQGFVEE
jgi:hypothetical protein